MAFSKVGFHGGTGPGMTGIGTYMLRLDGAGIPFVIKSVDNAGIAVEAGRLALVSGIPHNIIMRWTSHIGQGNEAPNLDLSPEEAARDMWDRMMQKLAVTPELVEVRDVIWLEPTNEVDTHKHAEFLGWFSFYIARMANAFGWKVALSGHNAGQPEPEHWRLPGFRAWLQYCSDNPDMAAVSLHEAKLPKKTASGEQLTVLSPVWKFYPFLVGRYTELFAACDEMGFNRPTTFISEWAWEPYDMPGAQLAMADIEWIAEHAARYPNIKGIFLWALQDGWGDLPGKLNALMGPITDLALNTRFPDPPPVEPVNEIGTVVYILRPENLADLAAEMLAFLVHNGIPLPDGSRPHRMYTVTYSHTDAERNVAMGDEGSLLYVVHGERIGTGLDAAWVQENWPHIAHRVKFMSLDVDSTT